MTNDSVFYCFAAVLPAAGVYSIISLFISSLLLNIFRPILRENASAVPYNGGNYSYLVNFTSKSLAIIAAAVTLLDAITTVSPLSKRNLIYIGCRCIRKCRSISRRRSQFTISRSFIDSVHSRTILCDMSPWYPRIE